MNAISFNGNVNSIQDLDAGEAAALISAATDIALVIDADGVIRDASLGDKEIPLEPRRDWVGRPWLDTVTVESRPKVKSLLNEAGTASAKWRQVNHATAAGPDLPILYVSMPIGDSGRVLAVGRNASPIAALQQRLLQTQQHMEKKQMLSRHLETRYRLLFQVSSEAVFIVDAATLKVLEANPASEQLLARDKDEIVGQKFTGLFHEVARTVIENLLVEVRASERRIHAKATLADQQSECVLAASLFNQDGGVLYLVRANRPEVQDEQPIGVHMRAKLIELMESAPDGLVVTGSDGRIVAANRAFIEMTQCGSKSRVLGESLDRWFGRSGVDLNVLTANLREHGSVRLFATTLHCEYGSSIDVEISATQVKLKENEANFGFMIRDTGVRLTDVTAPAESRFPRPVEQLTELVGRLPLRDVVQETTSMVERYCIEAALQITSENRTSAAELLGLSRQSLYVKLRRYGLGDSEVSNMETSE
ncbi:MAG: transcriptional regulator PpsR [Gammaproteobacteria bacterium]|nr:transcriptional regulator PpsR [Gammaproteobacteria bacterium]MCY4358375.1 transcriptional regulator PpsR [Gammaproteobacteria bacterium]